MDLSEEKERKISFKCCIPRRMSVCTDNELRQSYTTLKNAYMSISVCMSRIERELKKRGTSTSVFRSMRENPPPELIELVAIED
jgi:hypothetical protein